MDEHRRASCQVRIHQSTFIYLKDKGHCFDGGVEEAVYAELANASLNTGIGLRYNLSPIHICPQKSFVTSVWSLWLLMNCQSKYSPCLPTHLPIHSHIHTPVLSNLDSSVFLKDATKVWQTTKQDHSKFPQIQLGIWSLTCSQWKSKLPPVIYSWRSYQDDGRKVFEKSQQVRIPLF